MARLPNPGGDAGNWGEILNDFLQQEHNGDGTLKPDASLAAKADATTVEQITQRIDVEHNPDGSLKDNGSLASRATLAALPSGRRALKFPEHLDRWRYKLAEAKYNQANILCIGDSITAGQKAGSMNDDTVWRERGWVGQLRNLFADRYGDPGEGIVNNDDERVTKSGTQSIASVGIARTGQRLLPGSTMTFDLPACTTIRIYCWWESDAASEPFTYTIDGDSPIAATSLVGTDLYPIEEISDLSDTPHTLVLTAPATGHADISAVGAYRLSESGVAVHRLGVGGGYLNTGFIAGTGVSAVRHNKLTFVQSTADLAIINYGVNEGGAGQAIGKNPDDYKALLVDVTNFATSNGVDVILAALTQPNESLYTGPYYPSDFFAAMEEVAAMNEHVAFFDVREIWPDPAYFTIQGLEADGLHPNQRGHSDLAKMMYEALGGV